MRVLSINDVMIRVMQKIFFVMLLLGVMFHFQGCKEGEEIGVNPYEGAKEPLGIVFTTTRAFPESGLPGEVVTLNVTGLQQYENRFKLFLTNVEAEVVSMTESTVDIRIPTEVSSGIVTVVLDGQIFYGPRVGVEGKATLDTDFGIVNGFNSLVSKVLLHSGGYLVTGSFTNFENEATGSNIINSIHYLNSLGQSSNALGFRRSATGSISSIAKLPNGKFVAGGALTAFSRRSVGSIAVLNANGSLDTTVVSVINPDSENRPLNGFDTVSTFNGQLDGSIVGVFASDNNSVIAVGSFDVHSKIDYRFSSRENRRIISTRVKNVAKMKADGSLDSTFNVSNTGLNGFVSGVVQLNDGRIVIAGSFTSYNGKQARNIVCIKPNGEVDESFAVGGTDREIVNITYNSTTDKIAIAGAFKQFAGVANNGVIIMDASGAVDQNFKFGVLEEGTASFAYPLNNGRVFVQGSFREYNNVSRIGMLILEADGSAKQEYNNLGNLNGLVNTIVETTSSLGNPAILLGGFIFSIDGKNTGNIARIELRN